ncbi:MAG: nucleotide pyrophosphohydrolase [Betaproteobacteria bacterium]
MGNAIAELTVALREFARERDWEKFHTPKNLAMALMVEAAEVAEHFQWTDAAELQPLSPDKREAISLELADAFIYLLRLADQLEVDLLAAARTKMDINAGRYPIEKVFGKAVKYTDLGNNSGT